MQNPDFSRYTPQFRPEQWHKGRFQVQMQGRGWKEMCFMIETRIRFDDNVENVNFDHPPKLNF